MNNKNNSNFHNLLLMLGNFKYLNINLLIIQQKEITTEKWKLIRKHKKKQKKHMCFNTKKQTRKKEEKFIL